MAQNMKQPKARSAGIWRPFRKWHDLRLLVKLYSSYAVILLILLILSAFSLLGMNQIGDKTKELYEERHAAVTQILALAGDFRTLNADTAALMLDSADVAASKLEGMVERTAEISGRLEQLAAEMADYGISEDKFRSFQSNWNQYMSDWDELKGYIEAGNEDFGGSTGMEMAELKYTRDMQYKVAVLGGFLNDWVETNKALADEAYRSVERTRNVQVATQAALVAAAVALTGLVGWIVAQSILSPLSSVMRAAGELAQGKISRRVDLRRRDELGVLAESFNAMAENIGALISEVKKAGDMVAATSLELSRICEETEKMSREAAREIAGIAEGAESQMRTADESARAVNEMAQGMQHIAESTAEVNELAQTAHLDASAGNEAVLHAVRQIEAIRSTVEGSAAVIRRLEERSGEIGRIVELITEIADQTNLLSLNASIEAARAGEHGRGFAVVAGEVRKLAKQSRESADQISGLIRDIRKEMEQAAETMNRGTREVQEGVVAVKRAGEAFGKISASVERVFANIEGVTAVVEELSASTEEVAASADESARLAKTASANTQNAAAVTEEQLASIGQISDSAGHLNRLAQNLQAAIRKFEV